LSAGVFAFGVLPLLKRLLVVALLFVATAPAGAKTVPILDGAAPMHGSATVLDLRNVNTTMWSIDTNLDARKVEHGFTMQFGGLPNPHAYPRAYALETRALRFLGTPFVWGGATPSGFDCSGFVQHVFASIGVLLPRTADYQFAASPHISGTLRAGDLVFFQTYAPGASHVGIYLGEGEFVHSSRPFVHISRLTDPYYAARFIGATRPLN